MAQLRAVEQTGMDEREIQDDAVREALEARQEHKEALAEVRKEYREAHNNAMKLVERLELPPGGVARVGRFRITRTEIPARHVEFDADARTQISFGLAE